MFDLLVHVSGWAGHASMLATAPVIQEQAGHASHLVSTHKLDLVGGPNEVYDSGVESGGAPWSVNSYDVRPTDAAGLQAEGGIAGPYTCDTDGFMCSVYNKQAFDNGVVPNVVMLDKHSSPEQIRRAQKTNYMLYTNFGVGAETSHPKSGPSGAAPLPSGSACTLAEDCNGLG